MVSFATNAFSASGFVMIALGFFTRNEGNRTSNLLIAVGAVFALSKVLVAIWGHAQKETLASAYRHTNGMINTFNGVIKALTQEVAELSSRVESVSKTKTTDESQELLKWSELQRSMTEIKNRLAILEDDDSPYGRL